MMYSPMNDIDAFRQRLVESYNESAGLPAAYAFGNGTPVHPVLPRETAQSGVFILGAYPTAIFQSRRGGTIPIANIERPFAPDTRAGQELDQQYLAPLGIERVMCWVTNLVRAFLFKPEHIDAYKRLGSTYVPLETRSQFESLACSPANLTWLDQELQLAAPKVVITLGAEVAGILRGVKSPAKRTELLGGHLQHFTLGGHSYPCIHLAHPGIIMRKTTNEHSWAVH